VAKKKKRKTAATPVLGSEFRMLANGQRGKDLSVREAGGKYLFDELVVDKWFHIERMDHNAWWMRVGEIDMWIQIDRKTQKVRVNTYEGAITTRGFLADENPEEDARKAKA
jgi:hypothetical protein